MGAHGAGSDHVQPELVGVLFGLRVEIPEDFWNELAPLVTHFEIGVDR